MNTARNEKFHLYKKKEKHYTRLHKNACYMLLIALNIYEHKLLHLLNSSSHNFLNK